MMDRCARPGVCRRLAFCDPAAHLLDARAPRTALPKYPAGPGERVPAGAPALFAPAGDAPRHQRVDAPVRRVLEEAPHAAGCIGAQQHQRRVPGGAAVPIVEAIEPHGPRVEQCKRAGALVAPRAHRAGEGMNGSP